LFAAPLVKIVRRINFAGDGSGNFPMNREKTRIFLRNPPFAERLLEQKVLLSQWFMCKFAVQINREKIDA